MTVPGDNERDLRFRPRVGTASHDDLTEARRRLATAGSSSSTDRAAPPAPARSPPPPSSQQAPAKRPRSSFTPVVIKTIVPHKATNEGRSFIRFRLESVVGAIGSHFALATELSSLDDALKYIKKKIKPIVQDLNKRIANTDYCDVEWVIKASSDQLADLVLPAVQAVVPEAQMKTKVFEVERRMMETSDPQTNLLLVLHVVAPHVQEDVFTSRMAQLAPSHPYQTWTPTSSAFGNDIKYGPSRIVARLSQSMLDAYGFKKDLVISYGATPKAPMAQAAGSGSGQLLPVKFIRHSATPDYHTPPLGVVTESIKTTATASWQVGRLQQTVRLVQHQGVSPEEATKRFYASFHDVIAPPYLPRILPAGDEFYVTFNPTFTDWPSRTFATEAKAVASGRVVVAAFFKGQADNGRRFIETPSSAKSLAERWYRGMLDQVENPDDADQLGRRAVARVARDEHLENLVSNPGAAANPTNVCGGEFCTATHHRCKCGRGRAPSHPFNQQFDCDHMDGDLAAVHTAYTRAHHIVERFPLSINVGQIVEYDDGRSHGGFQRVRSLALAQQQPHTIFGTTLLDLDALASAVKASTTVYDPDLIDVAADLLELPEDIFNESPFDGHLTSTTFCVMNAALALGDTFDLTRQFDERAVPGTRSRLAHTTYSTRNGPTWAQPRRTRHFFLVGVVITGWHLNTCTTVSAELLDTAKEELDLVRRAVAPVDISYRDAGHSTDATLPDDQRALAREMSAMVEVDAPVASPHLLAAVQRERAIGVGPAAPNLALFLSHCRDTVSEQWVRDQHLPAAIEEDLVELVRFLHEEEDLIRNLVDPSTPRGIRYRRRVQEIEQYYGGTVPKKQGFPMCWFNGQYDDPHHFCRLALRHMFRMLFVCGQKQTFAGAVKLQRDPDDEGHDSMALTLLLDRWIVYYIQNGHLDEALGLNHDFSGELTSMKPSMAARREHGLTGWDGVLDPPIESIEHSNITVQSNLFNDLLESHHISTLLAIHAKTRKPAAKFLTMMRSFGVGTAPQSLIDAIAAGSPMRADVYDNLRRNGFSPDDETAWAALRAQEDREDAEAAESTTST